MLLTLNFFSLTCNLENKKEKIAWNPQIISEGMGIQLQTRMGPTKFHPFKTHKLENRGGGGVPDPSPPFRPGFVYE